MAVCSAQLQCVTMTLLVHSSSLFVALGCLLTLMASPSLLHTSPLLSSSCSFHGVVFARLATGACGCCPEHRNRDRHTCALSHTPTHTRNANPGKVMEFSKFIETFG